MEGQGVVNYSTDKPSHGFTTQTTEFDDELIRRGIISFEEAMMRKGASATEALRLKEVKEGKVDVNRATTTENSREKEDAEDDGDFLAHHRKKRLEELKGSSNKKRFGAVHVISRPEWKREVNEDSEVAWVVVNLTSSNSERTGCAESAVATLARSFAEVKFVDIASHSAIPNWPEDQLPTLFLYRHGKMQHQLVQLPMDMTEQQLEWRLAELGVLETDLDEEPIQSTNFVRHRGDYKGTTFGGIGSQLMTRDFRENYDSVD